MWYEDGIIYYYTSAYNPSLNSDAEQMFGLLSNLSDISGIRDIDVSNVISMKYMFVRCINLVEADLSNWNTNKLTNIAAMFQMAITPDEMHNSINNKLKRIILSENFTFDPNATETAVWQFASGAINLEDYEFVKYIDVSKAKSLGSFFSNNRKLKNLNGLKNWDVSNSTEFQFMFKGCTSLTDASAINNWNIKSNANFREMFRYAPIHANFTKIAGTWNSVGTFVPNS